MTASLSPKILALDFDGVICDGLLEYFQTTKRTYEQIWSVDSPSSLDRFAERFYRLRPVVETGWEMPILLKALALEIPTEDIENHWTSISYQLIESENLNKTELMAALDGIRDRWIEEDLAEWLSLHRFYPGVIEKLRNVLNSPSQLFIITTKESRFVKQLLRQQGLEVPESSIIGKEVKKPKFETLRFLLKQVTDNPAELWFVEDLLKTLQAVQQQPDLQAIKLFLADWGYNTEKTRQSIQNDSCLQLLSLKQFSQDFSHWLQN